ncbi:MAG: hypothetical protein EOL88_12325 [Bacteroidia bacterium]|nr:hypothetical protein [Bacteroidia bacterium]
MVNSISEDSNDPLLKVCHLLNKHHVKYLVVGGYACIMHGLVRTTEDVDLLVQEKTENYLQVIEALSELEDHAARELKVDDFVENVVIKVADEVEVDVSRRAWTVTYADAAPHALSVIIDGVSIPYVGLSDLIKSKKTYREKDKWDIQRLKRLAGEREPESHPDSNSLLARFKRYFHFLNHRQR